jgi:hypothetical protein
MSNTIVIDGYAGDLVVTDGYGSAQQRPVDDTIGPGAVITDVVARAQRLFITQFRQLRETV